MTAVPTHADTLALLPLGNTVTDFVDDAGHFMTGNARILDPGPVAFLGERVAVADTTGLYFDAHFSETRTGDLTLDDVKRCPGC